jgi:hypothetical protein
MTEPSLNASDLKHPSRQPTAPQGLKRFLPVSIRRKPQGWQVQVYWKRLAVALVLLGFVGWLGGASAAYLAIKYKRGFSEVRFTDILLLRRSAYREASGNFLIKGHFTASAWD